MGVPRYSDAALSARDLFFGSVVSVHFFVEDERFESLYEVVLSRIFRRLGGFKVFPLAGKQSVLQHARAGHSKPQHVTRVYILDKDFDDLLGSVQVLEGLFYLDHYCIENVVFDEAALLRVCVEERPRIRKAELRRRLSYRPTLDSWLPLLDQLHRAFALVQLHGLGIPNTESPPEVFTTEGDRSLLCQVRVGQYVERVRKALIATGVMASDEEYAELSRTIFGSRRKDPRRINGKFVARLHYHRLKRDDLAGNIKQDSFLLRCAQGSQYVGLRSFARRVRAYMRTEGVIA